MNWKFLLLCFIVCTTSNLFAQQTVSTAGNEATGSGGTVSFTVGQVDHSSDSSSTGTASQGVQQPYQISVVTGVEETNINILSFPNPTNGNLNITLSKSSTESLTFELYNSVGILVKSGKILRLSTTVEMNDLSSAIYIMKIQSSKALIKTFKIIKK